MIKQKLREITYGIKNIKKWLKVIWKDRDFDHAFLYGILAHKLKSMEDFWGSDKVWSANSEITLKEIKTARELADRLRNGNYLEEATKEHDKKYPNYLDKALNFKELPNGNYQLIDNNSEECQESFRRCSKQADVNRNEDRVKLFKCLSDHIEGWWD